MYMELVGDLQYVYGVSWRLFRCIRGVNEIAINIKIVFVYDDN